MLTNIFGIIVLAPIFIMLLIISFKALQSAVGFGRMHSFILSVCVSMLSVIGIVRYLKDSMETILLPYAALAIAVLLLLMFSFIGRSFKGSKDRLSKRTDGKNITEMNNGRLRR